MAYDQENPLFWKSRLLVLKKCSVGNKVTGGSQE